MNHDEAVRLAVYRGYVSEGRPPSVEEMAVGLALSADAVRESLHSLSVARHLVLRDDQVVMAHPFASIPLGFSVMGRETLWWGGCAWDSFAIPQLVTDDPEVLVATQCPGCGKPLAWVVNREAPPLGDEVAHFLVPMAQCWDDVVNTCSNQRLFCSVECVQRWAQSTDRGTRLRHGPGHAVAPGLSLVRGAPGDGLRATRAGPRPGVLPLGRAHRPVLGPRLDATTPSPPQKGTRTPDMGPNRLRQPADLSLPSPPRWVTSAS